MNQGFNLNFLNRKLDSEIVLLNMMMKGEQISNTESWKFKSEQLIENI